MIRSRLVPLAFAAMLAAVLSAQDVTGVIGGVVTDSSGAVVPGAKVVVVNTDTGVRAWSGVTNTAGAYTATFVPAGTYNLTFESDGFRRVDLKGVVVAVSDHRRADAVLQPGEILQTVVVDGGNVAHLEADSSSLGTEVDAAQLGQSPMPNRDILNLLVFTPGVSSGGDGTGINTTQLSINGSRTQNSEFAVGGVSVVGGGVGATNHYPSPDALREFKVMTSAYSAEYGRTSGASINMVVDNGNNRVHGALYEYFRNEDLNANNYFNNLRSIVRPRDRRNQFGGKFSGPILLPHLYDGRNRSFFFFNYEGIRQSTPIGATSTLPDASFRNGDFSASPTVVRDPATRVPFAGNQIPESLLNPAALKILKLLPLPNSGGSLDAVNNIRVNNYALSQSSKTGTNDTTSRIDHNFGDKTRIYGFFHDSYGSAVAASPMQIPGWLDPGSANPVNISYITAITLTRVFTPSLVGEFRAGYTRFSSVKTPPSEGINVEQDLGIQAAPLMQYAPTFTISGWSKFGTVQNTLQNQIDNNYQLAASATWVKGPHMVKWGTQLRKNQFNTFNPGNNLAGTYSFNGELTSPTLSQNNTVNAFADFMLGQVKTASTLIPQPMTGRRNYNLGLFVQDDWRISPRLMVNFGVREEYESPTTMANHMYSRIDPNTGRLLVAGLNASESLNLSTPKLNLAPRAGLAFRLDSKTVLRTGFGIFYSQNFSNLGGVVNYPGFSVTQNYSSLGNGVAQKFSLSQGIPFTFNQSFDPLQVERAATVANPLASSPSYSDLSNLPKSLQWNFGLQRQLGANFLMEANYVGTRGLHLPLLILANAVPSFNLMDEQAVNGQFISVQQSRPFPTVGSIDGLTNVGSSVYHSLQVRGSRQFSRSFSAMGAYTLSKSTDDGAGIFANTQPNGFDRGQFPQLSRRLDHALSSFDRPHSATISLRYTTQGPKWLRGFSIDPLLTLRSGLPLTISQSNLAPDVIQQRPNATAPITQIYASQLTTEGTGIRYLVATNSPQFPLAPTGPLFANVAGASKLVLPAGIGTLGRYPVRALGDINLNLALSRRFKITERLAFTVRLDSFNSMNHTNFNSPSAALSVVANSAGQGVFSSPNFGLITSARSARTSQLIARFDF